MDPLAIGGNKARKLRAILGEAFESESPAALLTCGGTQSNHCRVAALMAAERGWKCSLVLHGDLQELSRPRGNLLLMLLAGADVVVVNPDQISETLEEREMSLRDGGFHVLRIAGGGHEPLGSIAYADSIDELVDQCRIAFGSEPRTIVVPSGTGTTQGGLIAGIDRVGLDCRVIGVSVGRTERRGVEGVAEAYDWVMGSGSHRRALIDFRDDWLDGGYGKWSSTTLRALMRFIRDTGIAVDPTYVGKAVACLYDLLESDSSAQQFPVVLWHTGSIPVLLGADIQSESIRT